jgi:prefoldin subunit 5
MAIFSFGKKKEEAPAPPEQQPFPTDLPTDFPGQAAQGLPVDQINNLRSQGLSDNQIIQNLQRDGFSSAQVFDAMNQAGMNTAGPLPEGQALQGAPPSPPPGPMPPAPGMMPAPPGPTPDIGGDRERIEELAEAIIDEKWAELIKNINKIFEWKEKTDGTLKKLSQEMIDLKANFDKLHKGILGKITEYDQNIINVGTEVKAMEKVFQKVLPTFTDNVNELSRITKKYKSPKKKKV